MKNIIITAILAFFSTVVMAETETSSYPPSIDSVSSIIEHGNNLSFFISKEVENNKIILLPNVNIVSKTFFKNGTKIDIEPIDYDWTYVTIIGNNNYKTPTVTYTYYPQGLYSVKYSYQVCDTIAETAFPLARMSNEIYCNNNNRKLKENIESSLVSKGFEAVFLEDKYTKGNTIVSIENRKDKFLEIIVMNKTVLENTRTILDDFEKANTKKLTEETKNIFK